VTEVVTTTGYPAPDPTAETISTDLRLGEDHGSQRPGMGDRDCEGVRRVCKGSGSGDSDPFYRVRHSNGRELLRGTQIFFRLILSVRCPRT